MKKEKLLKRGLASLLAVVLAVGLLPMMPGNMATVKAADGDKTVSLGTDVIKNPTAPTASTDTWKGSYVYFGTYGGNPVKYRVLDKNTTVFGGTTMLLDCDSILWAGSNPSSAFDDNSNDWANSNIRTYLNETFLTNNFSAVEQSAIASSTKSTAYSGTDGADGDGWDGTLSYASLSNDKIFFLDAKEETNTSYGYSNNDGRAANREKTGVNAHWWLRSARTGSTDSAGIVLSDGDIDNLEVIAHNVGVSPALNINLSSVLFTSVISGTKGETGAEYKLTLLDSDMEIAGNGDVTRSGDTVTIPYTISGANSGNVNQISVLITDKVYTDSNAQVMHYGALDISAGNGTGTFILPAELSDKICGTDYYAYIIAEDVNGEKETDYASTPVVITVPASIVKHTITATAGANGSISPSGAVEVTEGDDRVFTITANEGYEVDTLKVDGTNVDAAVSYTFTNVTADHTIAVTFREKTQTPPQPPVEAPVITTQPGNATVKVGETATFTIAATGTDLTYQWQIDRNDGNGWVNIAGATATGYTTSTVDISCNGFKYQCVVSNLAGTVTSNTAVLTVTENTTPDPDPVDYDILDGANSSWTQNSDGSLSIRGSGAFSKFVGVKVDGSLVDAKNYTVKEGSTIVTLKADYLNTLSVGTHTFEILWTDGSASTTFTIKADTSDDGNNNQQNDAPDNGSSTVNSPDDGNKKDDVPKTGDNTPVAWLFILSILSGTGLIITAKKRRVNPDSSKR